MVTLLPDVYKGYLLIGWNGTLTQLGELLALQVRIMIIGMEIRLQEPGNV